MAITTPANITDAATIAPTTYIQQQQQQQQQQQPHGHGHLNHRVQLHVVDDDDDSYLYRMDENCAPLQYIYHGKQSSHQVHTDQLQRQQKHHELLAQQYRRACRPRHYWSQLEEVVPSDEELGIQSDTTRNHSNPTKSTWSQNSKPSHDKNGGINELLYPTQRDPGIIGRHFGNTWQDDDCPNHVSVSSASSQKNDEVDSLDDFDDNEAHLYLQFQDMGVLVHI
jgi:hypothetical protein